MKNLALAFCSIKPKQVNSAVLQAREDEYGVCLRQLKRILPESFDLVICDNTIDDISDITNVDLIKAMHSSTTLPLGSKSNIGTVNKGLGELLMLKVALDSIDYSKYDNICYVTARRIYTCPYAFDKAAQLEADALICNPDFLYVDGKFQEVAKDGMYNDMFFAMKSEKMKEYAEYSYSRLDHMNSMHIGSEQNLYSFIHEKSVKYEWLDFLGLIRNDWEINGDGFNLQNFHIT